jgi:arginase
MITLMWTMDCDMISYGTGTPVKDLTSNEVIEIINQIIKSRKVVCFEVVVNPLLDTKGNKMAETAFQVLEQTFHDYFTYRIIFFYSNIKA